MVNFLMHNLIILPALAFVFAAGTGIMIRKRSAREDKRYRELRFN